MISVRMPILNLPLRRLASLATFIPLIALLSACDSTKTGHSDYASNYPADGTYNPYPDGGGGRVESRSTHSAQYGQPVPPPPPGFTAPAHDDAPRRSTAGTSSTAKKSPSKATASKPSTTTKKPTNVASRSDDAPAKPKASSTTKKSSGGGVHTVVKGDNLWTLARKNDTTVAKLMALNGLSSDKLKLGQKIKLP